MEYSKIYVGMPVKTTKDENKIYEIIKLDEDTKTAICNEIGTQDAKLENFEVRELKEV